jgi:hypothetical protein
MHRWSSSGTLVKQDVEARDACAAAVVPVKHEIRIEAAK